MGQVTRSPGASSRIPNRETFMRRSTEVQDGRVIRMLRGGTPRKQVAKRLRLTYHQVCLAVYRRADRKKSQKKSKL